MLTQFVAIIVGTLLVPDLVNADDLSALWIEPSLQWYGIDGNWSSIGLFVGEPAQEIDVTVSTSLSELWVVETGGCSPNALCTSARGGVYDTSASGSWSPLGAWQLGLEYLGIGGNGDYGMETVVVYDSVRRWQTSFNKQLVAGINETGYYTGFFGLGITPGRFDDAVVQSPIAALVEQSGVIPSHSYGYTAGAYYGGERGTPLSLTLGGYDANRFEPHDINFSLNASSRQPEVLVRAITASVSDVDKAPTEWSTSSTPLLSFDESVTALLDSSTPYLWLPPTICDRFAESFNLTWNETFGLYLFSDNDILDRYRSSPDLSFTFTLSSEDNRDNFGQPLNVAGIVNITISANAFIQNLRYPFMNLIEYGAPAVPYFPLKRTESGNRVIIGRSFFQEAYLITNYETSTFSVHKAKFPEKPLRDTSIQTIAAYDRSPYPGPPPRPDNGGGSLTQPQIVGMVIGICCIGIAAIVTFCLLRRRRRKQRATEAAENTEENFKDKASTMEISPPTTPVARMVSKMSKNCPVKKAKAMRGISREEREDNKELEVYEFAADQSHERYELPAPGPVELDNTMIKEVMDTSKKGARRTSGYEFAKRQLERQKKGLKPEYTPRVVEAPVRTYHSVSPTDVSPTSQQYGLSNHTLETPSPTSSPTYDTLSNTIPSPLSSQSDWTNRVPEFYSPMGFVPTQTLSHSTSNPNLTYAPSSPSSPSSLSSPGTHSLARSASTTGFMTSHIPLAPPPASVQRAPIDASRVICLGPLPDNVRLPNQPPRQQSIPESIPESVPGVLHLDGQAIAYPPLPPIPSNDEYSRRASRRVSTADTLGSNYTVEEEAQLAAVREAVNTFGRIDGDDLIHIPQPALKRYSWEEQ
ncbi:acid protease [Hypoxylon cercidicola]|nr:acid protease [Hypoxylon cercidicola]